MAHTTCHVADINSEGEGTPFDCQGFSDSFGLQTDLKLESVLQTPARESLLLLGLAHSIGLSNDALGRAITVGF